MSGTETPLLSSMHSLVEVDDKPEQQRINISDSDNNYNGNSTKGNNPEGNITKVNNTNGNSTNGNSTNENSTNGNGNTTENGSRRKREKRMARGKGLESEVEQGGF
ncbi:putative uncharacterized protein DDB_G0277057 [Eurytemora carolleeae]|uniref:putative uncharacterized protein DDB_G0277057 n=1 Tax=Eurytemora carolleeae TaxID=1294199 RepID=UPI000C792A4B|nr:putative uncharacterized protein DDB_G0277057 [Eurytemora carolleeae]|eukprot:XP_023344662.1 putative uncharacterized protein DDB_G0277057 [Eurytemora affinis]